MRHVICHYHIYKNSGTSFDEILRANYGERHIGFDGPFPYFAISQQELAKIIQRNPKAKAFSSHQTSLPPPCSPLASARPNRLRFLPPAISRCSRGRCSPSRARWHRTCRWPRMVACW